MCVYIYVLRRMELFVVIRDRVSIVASYESSFSFRRIVKVSDRGSMLWICVEWR